MSLAEFFAGLGIATAETFLRLFVFGAVCFLAGFVTALIIKWIVKGIFKLLSWLWRLVRGL